VRDLKTAYTQFQRETDSIVAKGQQARRVFYRLADVGCIKPIRGHASKVVWLKREATHEVPKPAPLVLADEKTDLAHVFAILPPSLAQCICDLVPDYGAMLHRIVIEIGQPVTSVQGDDRPPIRLDLHDVAVRVICGKVTNSLETLGCAAVGDSLHTCCAKVDAATGAVVGITIRVARIVQGVSDVVEDLIMSDRNVAVLGYGKTTFFA
jgi:hypothetical protein